MSRWDWKDLCGRGENISTWIQSDFGFCFEQLAIVCPTYCVMAIVGAFYLAHGSRSQSYLTSRWRWNSKGRFALCLLLVLAPLLRISLQALVRRRLISIADGSICGVAMFAWLLQSAFQWKLKYLYWMSTRGPVAVNLAVLLTTVASAIQVRTVVLQRIEHSILHSPSEEIITYIILGFQVLFLITLIPASPQTYTAASNNVHVQEESDRLLDSGRTVRDYGAVKHVSKDLGVAEYAHCLSKLTFHWVTPLLVKGAKKLIENADDLFTLPSRLNTHRIHLKFSSILQGREKVRAHTDLSNSVCSSKNVESPGIQSPDNDLRVPHVQVQTPLQHNTSRNYKPRSLLSALNKAFGWEYYLLGVLKLLADCLGFAGPLLLNLLVTYIGDKNEKESNGYIYASGLFVSTFLAMFFTTQFDYNVQVVGFKIRAAIITTIYHKALAVNSVSASKFTTGEIVNFMSTDTDRIVNFCPSFHAFWSLPFQIGVSLYLLHQQVGVAFLAGLCFAVILVPVNKWLANKIGDLSTKMMTQKDARVKVMSEMLQGIRILKLYSWEEHFSQKITKLRELELKSLKGRKYLDALCVYFWATTPVLISILTFTTYSLMGHTLTAAKVFTSLSLFVMLISPLNAFPWVLNGLMEASVSLKRVQAFVQLKESQLDTYYKEMNEKILLFFKFTGSFLIRLLNSVNQIKCEKYLDVYYFSLLAFFLFLFSHVYFSVTDSLPNRNILEIDKATFAWFEKQDSVLENNVQENTTGSSHFNTLKLTDISLEVKKGMLVGVVGKVGCGKSSLLYAILGEVVKEEGSVGLEDYPAGFALASQDPWLQHATLRENILFGKPYNIRRYDQVVEACALSEDLQMLPGGDRTEIGENGVTLSGGQKARVALARAVYQDKDFYLLDDPLAAVDAHVAQHLFDKCIMGLLQDKTRILCTHHVKFLQRADLIVLMENGKIVSVGAPLEVLESDVVKDIVYAIPDQASNNQSQPISELTEPDSLVKEEEKNTGVVKFSVYKSYWKAVGNCLASFILLALFLMQASRNINDWWLSYWVTHAHHQKSPRANGSIPQPVPDNAHSLLSYHPLLLTNREEAVLSNESMRNVTEAEDNVMFYLTVYGCLAAGNSLFTLFRAFLYAYGGIRAAQALHKTVLAAILKAPIGLFDRTPIGRIVNRFSSDMYSIDDALPFILNILLAQMFGILGSVAITCYGLPWFSFLLIPLVTVYYFVQQYYRKTSREIKRISSVTLSPIYAHFSETIGGLATIRAFRHTDRFREENERRLDLNQRAQFAAKAVSAWLSFRLQLLGVAMVTGVAFTAVLEHHFRTVNPGLVGLAITYALSITNLLSGVVTSFTETEKQMISVERVQEYIDDTPTERWQGVLVAPPYWPIQGAVSFARVHLQYRPGLPDALNGVSFETRRAEKIGIVGRTGSGKSSLFMALFRLVEIQAGEIHIDGINIHHLDLTDLRSRLAIIPQDPFLFSGTVQDNLDPRGGYSDRELWSVLEKCHLKQAVERLGGLRADVAERGRHFSQGQKQLLCLARALLKRARVLCIDEATASVDLETDRYIQQTILDEFRENTVFTIAHRINTIRNADRIMVMANGKIIEFAAPAKLLENPKSAFYKLSHGNYS
ncbi:ATP-binding cassette sub-family C member 10-like [Liolophura sinensis]|uniref:ATP-binding cassette sub-family C member 10-like n=1 Tax=Liolophura sinensis TaxID=3198878 RepID=UPI003158CAAF